MKSEFTLARLVAEFHDRMSPDALNSPKAVGQSTMIFVLGVQAILNMWQEMADAGLGDQESLSVAHQMANDIDTYFAGLKGGIPLQ